MFRFITFVSNLAISLTLLACTNVDKTSSSTDPTPSPTPVKNECILRIGTTKLEPLICPTEDGSRELQYAIVNKDTDAANTALFSNLCYKVDPGTACNRIVDDTPFGKAHFSKVRILSGEHANKVGWVPTEQTR